MIVEMKTCYYELLGVDKKATSSEIKKVLSSTICRAIEPCPWSIILIRTLLNKQKRSSSNWQKLIMFFQIRTKELGTIITDKRYSLTKRKCQRKMLKPTHLDLIFGIILQPLVLRVMKMMKVLFSKFIGTYSKKLKQNKQNPLQWGTILNKNWENMKGLVIPAQF